MERVFTVQGAHKQHCQSTEGNSNFTFGYKLVLAVHV